MPTDTQPLCKFGNNCYRKNPKHFEEFSHDDTCQDQEIKKSPVKTSPAKLDHSVSDSDDEPVESAKEESPPKKKQTIEESPPKKKQKIEKSPPSKTKKIHDFFKPKNAATAKNGNDKVEEKNEETSKNPAVEKKPANKGASGYVRKVREATDDGTAPARPTEQEQSVDNKTSIKNKFLVEMPQDFYDFWEFAKTINSKTPEDAFKKDLGLQLVGPYDVLAGKCKATNSNGENPCYLRHWRYYYDPPEFLTVVKGDDKSQFHFGYFRDDPKEMPVFVASNAAKEDCVITARGENLFAAFNWFIEDIMKKDKSKKSQLTQLKLDIVEAAMKKDYLIAQKTPAMKAREKKVNSRTFHRAGMVVPVDDNEVGYREVPETPADLKKMLKKIVDSKTDEERNKSFDPLMEIIMLVQFANDECDYGEGLELGLDLFSYGGDILRKTILNLLPLAYEFLGRLEYKQIIEAHMQDRKHTAQLSQLE